MSHISFKKILIPVDFSKTSHKVFHHVKWLAQKFDSEVTLMHIYEKPSSSDTFPSLGDSGLEDFNKRYETSVSAKLEELREELLEAGIKKVETQYFEGNVAKSIRDYAEEAKIDLVAMGTHGTNDLADFFLGSNAFKIVNTIDLPVLTVHEKSVFAPYKNIVVPLDDSAYSRAKFPYIAELASTLGADVEILYPETSNPTRKSTINSYFRQVSDFLEENKIVHMVRSVEGNFAHEVVKFADYTSADLIVIMSDTDTTIANMLLGSTAQEIVNHSRVPVITLHPEHTNGYKEFYGQFF